jgi:chromosome segregation protein
MRLKRLELYGYKSFATRAVLDFGEGITAVVGPNGSGKSNVADAIRWVMGEQSHSTLRAKSTEDMIFSGSRHRARQGMAEVILTLDNSEGWLPIAFTEVTIGRRTFRSGETEYLLNGNRVRYRDVLGILGGAGLMRSSYTVIGQGMVDAALSLRPEARRALFEEAAGIVPHLRKRNEALARIAETEHNLERITDILSELHPRATTLRRQAERAEEHTLLSRDLQELQRIWYGYHWQRRQRQLGQTEERLREQGARLESQRGYAHEFEEKQDALNDALAAQRQALEELLGEQARRRDEREALQRESAVATERVRLYEQQRVAQRAEIEALDRQRGSLQQAVDSAGTELAEQEAAATAAQAEAQAARAILAQHDAAQRDLAKQATALQNRLAHLMSTLAEDRARLEQLGERRAEVLAARTELEAGLGELTQHLQELAARSEQLAAQERAAQAQQQALQQRQAQLATQVAQANEEIAAAEKAAAQVRAERDRLVARRELLERLRQELAGFYPGVREVLSAEARLQGLLGTVVNLMDVPKELAQAIESALGPRMQNIVAERWEDAEQAIAHLKRSRAGWATFLPLDTVRARPALTLKAEAGLVGVASALVRFEERLRPVFELLLGSTVIVADLPTARAFLNRRLGASLYVTLGGETVQPSGAVSGGTRQESSNLLAQEREWRDLPGRIQASEARLSEAQQRLAERQGQLEEARRLGREAERELTYKRAERDTAHTATANHAQEVRAQERERDWRTTRLAQLAKELEELTARERTLHVKSEQGGAEQAALQGQAQALQAKLAQASDDGLRQRVSALETRAAVAQRTALSQRTLVESHRANLAQLQRQIGEKEAQVARLAEELRQLAELQEHAGAALAVGEEQAQALRQRLDPAREEAARLERERRDAERQRQQSQERLNEAEMDHNRAIIERDRARDEQAVLAQEIEESLGPIELPETAMRQLRLSLGDDVIELPSVETLPPGLGDEIRQLKARLRRLGDVNPAAPQEYEQLLERQTFLQGQSTDLRGAVATLHEVVLELDKIIERDFTETVQRVNHSFSAYFRALFGGGTAHLSLTDPEQLSTSGVDIIAQPPGKRPQNLSLLSGGERALTAVALLFALLRANPVPFCFLDEVDAALDEANVARFRELLEEHAQHTQFVVITHNRRTIEAAHTIYGVSMGEQGVSQCISLKLAAEAERFAHATSA